MKIFHNPRCQKSRQTLQLIREKGIEPEIIEYLNVPPTENQIREILMALNLDVQSIIRKGEAIYKEQFKDKSFSDDEWVKILTQYPKLLERPLVIKGDKAIIGRPPENVLPLCL